MTKPASLLYSIKHLDLGAKIASRIDRGCHRSINKPLVFFRADDIGIPSRRFEQLIACFQKHSLPLCLATVPAWLNESRLKELYRLTGKNNTQWCWHQHGRVHRNFEKSGKKQEFGPARTEIDIRNSLVKGRQRLETLLEKDFQLFFTPPWNRCSSDTLQALADLKFQAVSRSKGATPKTQPDLPDYQVNVDLHTRKEMAPGQALDNFLREVEEGFASGLCGIMIHHQRMNRPALDLLELLLGVIRSRQAIVPVHFGDLPEQKRFATINQTSPTLQRN